MTTMDQLVTCGEAARLLGVSPPTLRKRIRRGDVEMFRDPMNDRIKLLRVEDLEAMRTPQPLGNRSRQAPQGG
jgi:hypothetical protein